jgi:imidazolonepropionase-like amidohydrolase
MHHLKRPRAEALAALALLTAPALLSARATAQDLTPVVPAQDAPVLIVGATVHTVSGPTIENGALLFDDGIITAVGPADDLLPRIRLDSSVLRIDAAGKHVFPGLISPVSQMGLTEISAVRATHDFDETGAFSPEVRAAVAVNPDSVHIPVTRSNGVLIWNAAPVGGRVPGRASVMRAEGWTWEDMTLEPDGPLVLNWPRTRAGFDRFGEPEEDAELDQIEAAMRELDAFFDSAVAYLTAKAATPDHPTDLRLEAMRSYLPGHAPNDDRAPRPILVFADDLDQITSAIAWASKRSLRIVIVGGLDAALCAEQLKAAGVPVIIDGTHRMPKRTDAPYDDAFSLPARLHAAGVRFAVASSEREGNERNLPYEAGRAVAFGLPLDQALRSVTLSAAEILGIEGRVGSIEVGKAATLFIADAHALEVSAVVEQVFIDGRAVDMTDRHKALRDLYTEKYRQLGILERPADN